MSQLTGALGSLKARAVSGIRWTMINAVGEKILSFGTTMVLARILDPKHFGLYALSFVAIDSFGVFKNLGLDVAVIQRKARVEDAATTALWVLPFFGLALYGLLYLSAPFLADWLGHPEVAWPIRVLGAILIFAGFSSVPLALLRRSMQFHLQAISNLTGWAVYAAVAILLALRGVGIWSLVAGYLARWTVAVPLQWALLRWRPRGRFDWALLKEMFQFGKYVVGAWTVAFVTQSVDKIVIGKWIGAKELGFYTLCYGLSTFATHHLSTRIFHVAFPAFAAAQAKPEVLREGFVKLTKYLLVVSLPVAVLLILAPRELLLVLYGKRWMVAAPILQVLAVAGALEAIRVGVEPVLLGSGRSKAVFGLNLTQLALLVTGATAMAMAGSTVGVAAALVGAIGVPCVIGLGLAMRQIHIRPVQLLRRLRPVGLNLLLMAAMVALAHLTRQWLRVGVGDFLRVRGAWLFGAACLGGLVYLLGLFWFDRPMVRDVLRLLGIGGSRAPKRPRTVLFVESGTGHGGSAACLLNLVRWMDRGRYRPVVAYAADGVGIEQIRQLGIPTVHLPPGGRLWRMMRIIRRERVALVHCNNEIYSQVSAIAAAALARVPCVCSLRASRPLTKRERIWIPLIRRFIAVSEATRRAYAGSGIPEDRLQTVYDGVDLGRFGRGAAQANGLPADIPLAPGRPTVGLVSRLIPEKGILEFLEAARQVVERVPEAQFIIVGGDPAPGEPYLRECRARASGLGLADRVIFAGWRSDVAALTRHFDVAAQASMYWEGWGMSLLEAMACGKPVVATRTGAVPEVVEDGTTGFLVEPRDSEALAAALVRLLQEGGLRRRMGEAGRRQVERRFDQRQQVQQMERLYAAVLKEESR